MSTLTACVNKVVKDGYTDSFKVTRSGLYSAARDRIYGAESIRIVDLFRFEAETDPADNAIMYVIATEDGMKGTLIDAYGPYADVHVNSFMSEIESISKQGVSRRITA